MEKTESARDVIRMVEGPSTRDILLVFYSVGQRLLVNDCLDEIRQRPELSVQILKIDPIVYPEIVNSFGVLQYPTFILVRQGVELWRTEGILEKPQWQQVIQTVAFPRQ